MKDAWCSCMLDARIRDSINDCQHFASFDNTKIGTCNVYQHIGGTFTKIRIISQGKLSDAGESINCTGSQSDARESVQTQPRVG